MAEASLTESEKVSTLGRTTTTSCGTLSSVILPSIVISTVRNMGEAFKKWNRSEALALDVHACWAESSNVVRFGKTKWFNRLSFFELKTNRLRLTAPPKNGSEGGVTALDWTYSGGVTTRVQRSGSGPEAISEYVTMSSQ